MDVSKTTCGECGESMRVTRLSCPRCGVELSGDFALPPLARLSMEEQIFVAAFVRSHGSIKKMEALFEISYPTVKNRLNAIIQKIDAWFEAPTSNTAVLDQLSRGEITVDEALRRLT